MARTLAPHPDRLFPADPGVRELARRIYQEIREAPIISPHGHVDVATLADDEPFTDPATLFITPDHYVTRLLHAGGVPLDKLGVGRAALSEEDSRGVWRILCERWALFRGTPVRYWLESELAEIFGVTEQPDAANADAIYDTIAGCLRRPEFRPRALFRRFGIDVLATTDDPCDDLAAHRRLAGDPSWQGRVVPTFRPDRYLEPGRAGWRAAVDRLGEVTGIDTGDYAGYVRALEERRRYFHEHGAVSADHSHPDVRTDPLDPAQAARVYAAARAGTATEAEATAFRRHMLLEMARMSTEDGLVMTLHPGIRRGHHTPTSAAYGPDTGHDIPLRMEFTDALRPLLERFGTHPNLTLVLFTVDETTYSREIAPLAGFYPAVFIGAPWWFLDAPDAIRRFRGAVTETAGYGKLAGFVDDTRAFCSIPARHDMARRLDARVLAELVAEHRLDEDEAIETARDLVGAQPMRVFRL
ncbi:glucuronate isomerase [Amycolatopsis sp. K13G38]|uniref:Uronate isomerase n=1 Tax=Amycolatopsis acididurans TaxID=2724524 RepID=A0ABX1IYT1_9PSEU|nr:glucuronate isomerase [Amycolatopsis acididurans]NKQ52680.1 glucuronate isomerase [Amycolatopsis acididurans]